MNNHHGRPNASAAGSRISSPATSFLRCIDPDYADSTANVNRSTANLNPSTANLNRVDDDQGQQTTPPDNPETRETEPSMLYTVGRLDRVVRNAIDAVVSERGISVTQYTVLSVLSHRTALSNAQLARRSYVSPQSMMEVLKVLEELGLVKRKDDPNHGRIRQTRLTPKGRKLLERCDGQVAEIEARMTNGFTKRDHELFDRLLVRAVQNLGGGFSYKPQL